MSEYRHYEFQAIDRPLGEADMEALRTLSTRARITATSFTNRYKWGDFKGDPNRLIGRSRLDPFRRGCDLAEVRRMADDGLPIKQIGRMTGLSRNLVRQIQRDEREDVFRLRQSSLEPWLPRLAREWNIGCRNGTELWRRLRAEGFKGSLRVVTEWATR